MEYIREYRRPPGRLKGGVHPPGEVSSLYIYIYIYIYNILYIYINPWPHGTHGAHGSMWPMVHAAQPTIHVAHWAHGWGGRRAGGRVAPYRVGAVATSRESIFRNLTWVLSRIWNKVQDNNRPIRKGGEWEGEPSLRKGGGWWGVINDALGASWVTGSCTGVISTWFVRKQAVVNHQPGSCCSSAMQGFNNYDGRLASLLALWCVWCICCVDVTFISRGLALQNNKWDKS